MFLGGAESDPAYNVMPKTTVKNNPYDGFLLHLRIAGTVPGTVPGVPGSAKRRRFNRGHDVLVIPEFYSTLSLLVLRRGQYSVLGVKPCGTRLGIRKGGRGSIRLPKILVLS